MRTVPRSADSNPAAILNVVDLPQPDGPTRTVSEPSARVRFNPSTTAVPPYTLLTLTSSTVLTSWLPSSTHRPSSAAPPAQARTPARYPSSLRRPADRTAHCG